MENTSKLLGTRIRQAREARGLQQKDLAKAVGVAPSTIQRYEAGTFKSPKLPVIESIANVLRIDPVSLISIIDTPNQSTAPFDAPNVFPIQLQRVPLLGSVACGQPIYAPEERGSYVETCTDIKADFCLKAKGDSMIGARIQDGDIVFIREQPRVENGEIAAVVIDDEATLKRVYYNGESGQIVLSPENPKYAPLVYSGEALNRVRVLGKAVAFQSNVS